MLPLPGSVFRSRGSTAADGPGVDAIAGPSGLMSDSQGRPRRPFSVDCSMDKAHILAEIKRTAAANGGMPLGRQRFFAETGIKQSDWEGVHWARWSEALQEAGFAPNQLT